MNQHEIVSIALAYWRCSCGFQWSNEKLRDELGRQKSDEDLSIEAREEFAKHQENP